MGEHVDMVTPGYVQPVAAHCADGARMIARDLEGGWWLWRGDRPEQPLEAIPASLAAWMLGRAEMQPLPQPRFWFPLETLPTHHTADPAILPPGKGD
ncbi:MAG: hypothetical protein WBA46_12780 [Thermomicrobiales bacterium]